MTELQWLTSSKPSALLASLRGAGASERKLRLVACACIRLGVWDELPAESRRAIAAREAFEDGRLDTGELEEAQSAAWQALTKECIQRPPASDALRAVAEAVGRRHPSCIQRAVASGGDGWEWMLDADARFADETERWAERVFGFVAKIGAMVESQCGLLRCVFGERIRVGTFVDPAWLAWGGGIVPRLAQAAYDERLLPSGRLDPAVLTVLADALEDVGCADAELVGHLRSPGPHVRGCWGIDVLTGRR